MFYEIFFHIFFYPIAFGSPATVPKPAGSSAWLCLSSQLSYVNQCLPRLGNSSDPEDISQGLYILSHIVFSTEASTRRFNFSISPPHADWTDACVRPSPATNPQNPQNLPPAKTPPFAFTAYSWKFFFLAFLPPPPLLGPFPFGGRHRIGTSTFQFSSLRGPPFENRFSIRGKSCRTRI